MAIDYLFRRVHCTKNYIHMNLMISMLLLYVFTLVHNPVAESFLKFKYYEDKRTHHRLMVSGKSFYSSCIFGQLVENHHKLFEVLISFRNTIMDIIETGRVCRRFRQITHQLCEVENIRSVSCASMAFIVRTVKKNCCKLDSLLLHPKL